MLQIYGRLLLLSNFKALFLVFFLFFFCLNVWLSEKYYYNSVVTYCLLITYKRLIIILLPHVVYFYAGIFCGVEGKEIVGHGGVGFVFGNYNYLVGTVFKHYVD